MAAAVRRGRPVALGATAVPGVAGLLVTAAVMNSGLTVTGVQAPWSDETYPPGIVAMAVVQLGLQFLPDRRRGGSRDRNLTEEARGSR